VFEPINLLGSRRFWRFFVSSGKSVTFTKYTQRDRAGTKELGSPDVEGILCGRKVVVPRLRKWREWLDKVTP
jgi:hypothetical protein